MKRSTFKLILLKILFIAVMLFLACQKNVTQPNNGTIPDIDISGSANGVVPLTGNVPVVLQTLFNKYTKVTAPNGKPIHIFASVGVSDAQAARARKIMEFILRDAPGTHYGSNKSAIANTMANNKATLVYFDTEAQSLANRDKVADLGLFVQDLYATESPVEGSNDYLNNITRDAAYEEIFHLVQGAGIQTALSAFHAEIVAAEQQARAAGIYRYDDPSPDVAPFEYIISCIDIYYGLWAHLPSGPSFGGEYDPHTPENLKTIDPTGYELVEKLFPPYLDWNVQLDPAFDGMFDLKFDSAKTYTLKSKFMKDVTLTGFNNSNLRGNELNNTLTGNSGANTVFFTGASTEYTITTRDGTTTVIDNIPNRDGTDTLRNIEFLQFGDRLIQL